MLSEPMYSTKKIQTDLEVLSCLAIRLATLIPSCTLVVENTTLEKSATSPLRRFSKRLTTEKTFCSTTTTLQISQVLSIVIQVAVS